MHTIARTPNNNGFTLVELLVGMIVGIATIWAIMQSYKTYEGQRRTTGSTSDTINNGQYAVYQLERDIMNGGWGFQFGRFGIGCSLTTKGAYAASNTIPTDAYPASPSDLAQGVMAPVLIVSGGSTAPDALRIMYGTAPSSVPRTGGYVGDTFQPSSMFDFFQGELYLLQSSAGGTCQLAQMTNNPTDGAIALKDGTGPCGPNIGGCVNNSAFNATTKLSSADYVAKLGSLVINSYVIHAPDDKRGAALEQTIAVLGTSFDNTSTDAGTPLSGSPYISNSTTKALTTALVPDVVNLKAQYGLDTNKTDRVSVVDSWVDATGDYAPSKINTTIAQQIRAIRFALVVRSPLPENKIDLKIDDKANCIATPKTTQPTSKKTLTWPDNSTIEVDLSFGASARDGDGDKTNWRCYRYQTFMSVVPLRNTIWSVKQYE